MMFRKSVLRACLIGIALFMMYGACKAQPNTVIGCVEVPGAFYATCGFNQPFGMAITPDGKKAYVTNSNGAQSSVSVIDVASDTVIRCVNVPYAYAGTCGFNSPLGIAITPDGKKAYVCNNADTTVSIIDVASDTVIGCVDVPYAYAATCDIDSPFGIVITPMGITPAKAYVTNQSNNTVSVIDVASDTVIACVDVPYAYDATCPISQPEGIAITPNGKKVYIINFDGNVETVVDVASDSVVGCIETPYAYTSCEFDRPQAMAITPDGKKGYITNSGFLHNSVSIIDVASDSVIGCVEVPYAYDATCGFQAPQAIAITPDGTTAYLTNFDGNSVSIIDVASDTVIGCVDVPYAYAGTCGFSGPQSITITPDGTKAYVTNLNGNSVSVIEIKSPTPSILPPASVNGCKTKNIFLLQTDFINNITWTAPASGSTPVGYKIYRDPALTQLVATVPASGPLQFYDHDRQPNVIYSYYIVSVDGSGNVSTANSVTVTNPC